MNSPPQNSDFIKKKATPTGIKQEKVMYKHMMQYPPIPNTTQRLVYTQIPAGINIPWQQGQGYYTQLPKHSQQPKHPKQYQQLNIYNPLNYPASCTGAPGQTISQSKYHPCPASPSLSVGWHQRLIFHPCYFLFSQFPILSPNDQIYLPIINRLQNKQTKECLSHLYINIKFLLVQSHQQFWKYLTHLSIQALSRQSQKQINQGYKLRVALEACLANLTVKEFNKCLDLSQVRSSSVAVQKRIYQQEVMFQSQAFEIYQKLVQTVLQFYQTITKAKSLHQAQIVIGLWYVDTVKVLDIAMIYGNKEPSRVKQLIKRMFLLSPRIYTKDFTTYLQVLHCYIQNTCSFNEGEQAFSLLENLSKSIQAVPNTPKHKSNYHNPEKYFAREIFSICSECLKLFIIVTNIFKFFPSSCKIIFMENTNFLRTLIKISVKVVYNLRGEEGQKKRKWKFSSKVKQSVKDLEFILLQKITQMYKFIFLNTKNALQQQICTKQVKCKTGEQLKQQRVIVKFYKKLIQCTINRKKDKQKDKQFSSSKNRKQNTNQTANDERQENELISKSKSKIGHGQNEKLQDPSKDEKQQKRDKQKKHKKKSRSKQSESLVIPQRQYGRVFLRYLLMRQLKKNSAKYLQFPYYYTQKAYSYYKDLYFIGQQEQEISFSGTKCTSQPLSSLNLYLHIRLAHQFQQQVKQQFLQMREMDRKQSVINMQFRKLPSLGQWTRQQEIRERDELRRKLNSYSKQYQDEPTQEWWLQMQLNRRLMDSEDFTVLGEEMFGQGDDSELSFSNNHNMQKKNNAKSTYKQFQLPSELPNQDNDNSSKSSTQQWSVPSYIHRQSSSNSRFLDEVQSCERQLSPEEISQFQQSQFITQRGVGRSNSDGSKSNADMTTVGNTDSRGRDRDSRGRDRDNRGRDNEVNMTKLKHMNDSVYIFKPHETMKRVKQSMLREDLQSFYRIKVMDWQQISRISFNSLKKNQKKVGRSTQSRQSSLVIEGTPLKVSDIGLSFDMLLPEQSSQKQFSQNRLRHSHFYYDQWRDTQKGTKHKSFMEEYQWSDINEVNQ